MVEGLEDTISSDQSVSGIEQNVRKYFQTIKICIELWLINRSRVMSLIRPRNSLSLAIFNLLVLCCTVTASSSTSPIIGRIGFQKLKFPISIYKGCAQCGELHPMSYQRTKKILSLRLSQYINMPQPLKHWISLAGDSRAHMDMRLSSYILETPISWGSTLRSLQTGTPDKQRYQFWCLPVNPR